MTKKEAIEELETYKLNNSNYDEDMVEAIEIILKLLKEQEYDIELNNECEIALNNRIMDLKYINTIYKIKIKSKIKELKEYNYKGNLDDINFIYETINEMEKLLGEENDG